LEQHLAKSEVAESEAVEPDMAESDVAESEVYYAMDLIGPEIEKLQYWHFVEVEPEKVQHLLQSEH